MRRSPRLAGSRSWRWRWIAAAALALIAGPALAQPAPPVDMTVPIPPQAPPPQIADDGTVALPAFALPFSAHASAEARAAFVRNARMQAAMAERARAPSAAGAAAAPLRRNVAELRKIMAGLSAPTLAKVRQRFPYASATTRMGGVPVEIFTPSNGIAAENRERVLINLHGGGFILGGGGPGGVLESAPVAHFGRIKVVSIDYRMAPEFRFPAASEDVAAVYRELLKSYRPERIGIYGCSSGGELAAQAVAWFQRHDLPRPGAIGVLCSSLQAAGMGDSAHLAPRLAGGSLPRPAGNGKRLDGPYFVGASPDDPLAVPAASIDVLRAFPPTLFLTGSRAAEASSAAKSQIDLRLLGVDADLILFDGLGHGFFGNPDLTESDQANQLIARFFTEHLAR